MALHGNARPKVDPLTDPLPPESEQTRTDLAGRFDGPPPTMPAREPDPVPVPAYFAMYEAEVIISEKTPDGMGRRPVTVVHAVGSAKLVREMVDAASSAFLAEVEK